MLPLAPPIHAVSIISGYIKANLCANTPDEEYPFKNILLFTSIPFSSFIIFLDFSIISRILKGICESFSMQSNDNCCQYGSFSTFGNIGTNIGFLSFETSNKLLDISRPCLKSSWLLFDARLFDSIISVELFSILSGIVNINGNPCAKLINIVCPNIFSLKSCPISIFLIISINFLFNLY